MEPERLQRGCVEARERFYAWKNIWRRGLDPVNRADAAMWWHFYGINALFRREVRQPRRLPVGRRGLARRADPGPRAAGAGSRRSGGIAIRLELAVPGDPAVDVALRRLLRENPLPGKIVLAYEREPSYFAAAGLEGPFHQTLVARDVATGEVLGCANRSVRSLFVNGEARPVGYMSQLRLHPRLRRGLRLARCLVRAFELYRTLHADGAPRST